MTKYENRRAGLLAALRGRRVVVILGAGVSAASSSSTQVGSWAALIESGVSYYLENVPNASSDVAASIRGDLHLAQLEQSATSAAQKLTEALGGHDSAHFAQWLRRDVGEAKLSDSSLIKAIDRLDCPVATVNYDELVEKVTNHGGRTWLEGSEIQSALVGKTRDISHLHGIWTRPQSIIFGSFSYGRLSGDRTVQALERAIGLAKSILFIGCGSGLNDPNFESLRRDIRDLVPESQVQHFRLCLDSEVEELDHAHRNENIVAVPYGANHSDLVPFLEALHETGVAQELTDSEKIVLVIEDQIRSESVFAQQMPDLDFRQVNQVVVPPVVLPVSPEQFADYNRNHDEAKLTRSDLIADLETGAPVILVGDESSGLTTALQWVAHQVSLKTAVLPLVVDYRNFVSNAPLDRALRKTIRTAQARIAPGDPIPAAVVAVDNVAPGATKVFAKFQTELMESSHDRLILGCRTGSEAALEAALARMSRKPIVRYLGRLNRRDILDIARLVAPHQAETLAAKALEVIHREHLARKPMTVCLLLSVLLTGEALLSTASATSLLDAYIQLLLGRGSALDDARLTLDAHELSSLLARLAERYVEADTGALGEADVISCFEEYFETKGWEESAVDSLTLLKSRHILTWRNGKVQFTQSSFLHLFAAKRAMRDKDLKQKFMSRPYRYAEIIKHYAALTRDDRDILQAIGDFAIAEATAVDDYGFARSTSLSTSAVLPNPEASARLDALLERFHQAVDDQDVETVESAAGEPLTADPLDDIFDDDIVAFPVTDVATAAPITRMINTISLISTVLRDSEEVEDLHLKRQVLAGALSLWGRMVDALDADDDFAAFSQSLAESLAEEFEIAEEDRGELTEHFLQYASLLICAGGIAMSLTSRKLFLMLKQVLQEAPWSDDAGIVIMGSMMAFELRQKGWGEVFLRADACQPEVVAVQDILLPIAMQSLHDLPLDTADEESLTRFAATRYSLEYGRRGTIEQKNAVPQVEARLRQARLKQLVGRQTTATFNELESRSEGSATD